MASTNDFIENLGNTVGNISNPGTAPAETPEGKIMAAQVELDELQKQESALLLIIGREAYDQNPEAWPQDTQIKRIRADIEAAQTAYNTAKQEQEWAEAAKAQEEERMRCARCGGKNPEGNKFCQECGIPLAPAAKRFCTSCSTELTPDALFCNGCGTKL